MKKEISFLLTGAVLFFALSWIIDEGARHSDYEQIGKINAILRHTIDPGIMIFGSSASENGINPKILEANTHLNAFNASLTASRFQEFEGLIREFTSYSKNCKMVLFAETYSSFESKPYIMAPDFYMHQLSNPAVFNYLNSTNPALIWKCRYIPLYKYTVVKSLYYQNSIRGWENIFHVKRGPDSLQGFFPVDNNWDLAAEKAIQRLPKFTIALNEELLARYTQTLRGLKASGKTVIILLMPTNGKLFHTKTDLHPLREKLQEISQETGCIFLDFSNHEIGKRKELFFNSSHLNRTGANIFSNIIADSLNMIIAKKQIARSYNVNPLPGSRSALTAPH